VIATAGGAALALAIAGAGTDHKPHAFRGITSADGARDIVAFAAVPPETTAVGAADLDGDGTDELVTAGTKLVVTAIRVGAFVDIVGPTLRAGCQANVNVEADFHGGARGDRKALVIAVDAPAPRKGCPATGRHFYHLAGDAVVAD
jgi:hypothetical protein